MKKRTLSRLLMIIFMLNIYGNSVQAVPNNFLGISFKMINPV